ncbi:MAG: hypothetical protein AABY22_32400 [Nanoarchaeota archaeon]
MEEWINEKIINGTKYEDYDVALFLLKARAKLKFPKDVIKQKEFVDENYINPIKLEEKVSIRSFTIPNATENDVHFNQLYKSESVYNSREIIVYNYESMKKQGFDLKEFIVDKSLWKNLIKITLVNDTLSYQMLQIVLYSKDNDIIFIDDSVEKFKLDYSLYNLLQVPGILYLNCSSDKKRKILYSGKISKDCIVLHRENIHQHLNGWLYKNELLQVQSLSGMNTYYKKTCQCVRLSDNKVFDLDVKHLAHIYSLDIDEVYILHTVSIFNRVVVITDKFGISDKELAIAATLSKDKTFVIGLNTNNAKEKDLQRYVHVNKKDLNTIL